MLIGRREHLAASLVAFSTTFEISRERRLDHAEAASKPLRSRPTAAADVIRAFAEEARLAVPDHVNAEPRVGKFAVDSALEEAGFELVVPL
jgi:hypothetical protein